MKPYALLADLHLHNWQSFSATTEAGVNSRLKGLLDEITRTAQMVKAAGGDKLILAGDIFHVRGSIAPSVLNPVMDCLKAVIAQGVDIHIIPGNHDLEGKHSARVSNAVTALEGIGCHVAHESHEVYVGSGKNDGWVVMVPWFDKIDDLKAELQRLRATASTPGKTDLILHAPIDGVISGLPDHGLSAEWLAELGFRRIFSGHYHNHKDFGNGVYSIGALAHHTWSDVGSKAGFLLVGDEVKWFKSHLPDFVDINDAESETDAAIMADGAYVRVKVKTSKTTELNEIREFLEKNGAKGIVINTVKEPTQARDGGVAHTVTACASIETSIGEYVKTQGFEDPNKVQLECQKILAETAV